MKVSQKRLLLVISMFIIGTIFTFSCGLYAVNGKKSLKQDYENNIKISYNSNTYHSDNQNSLISKYIECYEHNITEEDFDENVKNKLNELYDYVNNNGLVSFAYEDLETGLHISFNEDQTYFVASTIKAPVALYVYEQAEQGKIDLNSYVTYTPNFYLGGSGSIQYQGFGGQYKLRDLVRGAIVESDNIAYQMMASVTNYEEIKKFWNDKGATNFWSSYYWGEHAAKDGVVYMKEIYNYSLKNSELSNELIDLYDNSVQKLIKSSKGSKVIHKSGWHYEYMHDTGVVFDEHPYALAIMSTKGNSDYIGFFNQMSQLIENFHDSYWNLRTNFCKFN